ncbi:uncharacterized protein MONBRDRAFT_25536 [Monosiga brevicollis MX1]|uniref:TNFR-Cys domain-containing protein n=1 Tax=Monosiga brevicollis TaxID=81824 RepID=A9UZP9_MONBE|nr:uncharacterized protein MONBRDRAFT_25536 [Monosiga brevicollis MX1]EDQ89405.1 predicted protein [Monosiga brevicollis MX1]|eukprot:XP_001745981.1 hypothetical protein [Monosiga brevicollis MX1]
MAHRLAALLLVAASVGVVREVAATVIPTGANHLMDASSEQALQNPSDNATDLAGLWRVSGITGRYGDNCLYSTGAAASMTAYLQLPEEDYWSFYITDCPHETRSTVTNVVITQLDLPESDPNRMRTVKVDQTSGAVGADMYRTLARIYMRVGLVSVQVKQDPDAVSTIALDAIIIRRGVVIDTEDTDTFVRMGNGAQYKVPAAGTVYLGNNVVAGSQDSAFVEVRTPVEEVLFKKLTSDEDFIIFDGVWLTRTLSVDNGNLDQTSSIGSWTLSTSADGFANSNYLTKTGVVADASTADFAEFRWNFNVRFPGIYRIGLTHKSLANAATSALVGSSNGPYAQYIQTNDQSTALGTQNQFSSSAGQVYFDAGSHAVWINNIHGLASSATTVFQADAVHIEPVRNVLLDPSTTPDEVTLNGAWESFSSGSLSYIGDTYHLAYASASTALYNTPKVYGVMEVDVEVHIVPYASRSKNVSYTLHTDLNPRPVAPTFLDHSTSANSNTFLFRTLVFPRAGQIEIANAYGAGSVCADSMTFRPVRSIPHQFLDTDDTSGKFSRVHNNAYHGVGYYHDSSTNSECTVTFNFDVEHPGLYALIGFFPTFRDRATSVPLTITDAQGQVTHLTINMSRPTNNVRQLARLELPVGSLTATISNDLTSLDRGYVNVDAMLLTLLNETCDYVSTKDANIDSLVHRCQLMEPCLPGEFRSDLDQCSACAANTFSTGNNAVACDPHSTCEAGWITQSAPTSSTDRVCVQCGENEFADNGATCNPCRTSCGNGFHMETNCTSVADAVCVPNSDCTNTQYIASSGDGVNDVVCGDCTVCHPGEYMTHDCDETSNRICVACDGVTGYSDSTNAASCTSTSSCDTGSYLSQPPTASSDLECVPCMAGTADHDSLVTTECQTCQPGTYVPAGSTGPCASFACAAGQADTDSNPRTACESCYKLGKYQNTSGATVCNVPRVCPIGTTMQSDYTATTNRVCVACASGKHKNAAGTQACVAHSTCGVGMGESVAPTSSSDRECMSCGAGLTFNDGRGQVCLTCATCDGASDEFIAQNCTATSDTICETFAGCEAGSFQVGKNDGISPAQCQGCRICQSGEYMVTECGASSDRTCQACGVGKFSTGVNVLECTDHQVCAEGSYQSANGTATRDTSCELCVAGSIDDDHDPHTACVTCEVGTAQTEVGAFECTACPAGWADLDADPSTPCEPCEAQVSYQPLKGQVRCLAVVDCPPGARESEAPSVTANRGCEACFQGLDYSSAVNSPACTPATQCQAGEEQAVMATTTSDRVCRTCPLGTFKASGDSATATPPACNAWRVCTAPETYVWQNGTTTSNVQCASSRVVTFLLTMKLTMEAGGAFERGLLAAFQSALIESSDYGSHVVGVAPIYEEMTSRRRAVQVLIGAYGMFDNSTLNQTEDEAFGQEVSFAYNGTTMVAELGVASTTTTTSAPTTTGNRAAGDPSASTGSSGSDALVLGVAIGASVLGVFAGVGVLLFVQARRRKLSRKAQERDMIGFENPMYDNHERENPVYESEGVGLEDAGHYDSLGHAEPFGHDQQQRPDFGEPGYLDVGVEDAAEDLDPIQDGYLEQGFEGAEDTGYLDQQFDEADSEFP